MSTSPEEPEALESGTIIFNVAGARGLVIEPIVVLDGLWKYKLAWNLPDKLNIILDPTEPPIWEMTYGTESDFRVATDDEEGELLRAATSGVDSAKIYPGANVRITGSKRRLKRYRKWAYGCRGRVLYRGTFPFGNGDGWEVSIECPSGRFGRRTTTIFERDMTLISPLELLALEA